MIQCPRCRHANGPQARFCEECATPLGGTGTRVSPSGKVCPECAHPLAGAAAAPPRSASPDTYTPKHLAERILTSKAALLAQAEAALAGVA